MAIELTVQDDYSKFDYIVEIELEEFRRYTLGLEGSIIRQQKETEKWVDKVIWPDKKGHMPTMAIEVLNHVHIFQPSLFYKSTLTVLYTFFESNLRELAKFERDKRKLKIKPNDLRGEGISLYKDYFIKVIGIDLTTIEHIWSKIDKVRKIRNSIVHNDFDNPDSEKIKEVIKICQECEDLQYAGEVVIQRSKYLIDFTDNVYEYLREVIKLLRQ